MSFAAKQVFAPLPETRRAQPTVLNGDPKGKNFVYANGSAIVIRDIKTPMICDLYTQHSKNTTVAAYSPSGFYMASGDESGVVKIWDTVNKEHVLKFEMHAIGGAIRDIAWTEDSKRIIAVGEGRELMGRAFFMDGRKAGDITGHAKGCSTVSIRQKRKFRAITGDSEPLANWYNGYPWKWDHSIKMHTRFLNCARFSPNGDHVITVGSDKKGFILDGDTGAKKGELLADGGHKGGIYAASWSPDSTRVLTASADKTCKLWDVSTGKCVTTFTFSKDVRDQQLGCLWQGDYLLSLSLSGEINYLDVNNPSKPIRILAGHNQPITSLATDETSFYTGDMTGNATKWNAETGDSVHFSGKGHTNKVSSLAVSGKDLISCAMDDSVRITPTDGAAWAPSKIGIDSPGQSVDVSKNFAVAASMKSVYVVKGGKAVADLKLDFNAKGATISDDGTTVVVGGETDRMEPVLRVYTVAGDKLTEKAKLEGHAGAITNVSFSPDGKMLAVADKKRSIFLWDTSSWKPIQEDWGVFHSASISVLAWSPDSAQLASGSVDSHVIIWNVKKPTARITIKFAHPGGVNGLSWKNATTLVSAGSDSSIKSWTITSA